MNAPSTLEMATVPGEPVRIDRAARRAEVVAELSAVLPAHALLWHTEDTIPYECDGLTAYRERPLAVALPENEEQVAARAAHLPSPERAGGGARRGHRPVRWRLAAQAGRDA